LRKRKFERIAVKTYRKVDAKESEMKQDNLSIINGERLFEALCSIEALKKGYEEVRKNHGAPGIDGVTVEELGTGLDEELRQLKKELESWTYRPKPVRGVKIPKPGNKGVRLLGIPCTRDRVVQGTIKQLLEPIFEPKFSENSYGFRPGKNQHQAIEAAQRIVRKGKDCVVDIDLAKFFDRIQHNKLIGRLSRYIPDKQILRVIGVTLRSGIMKGDIVSATTEGTVQGSPLSPLMSNIVLDELDKELGSRNLEFCRFADDCNIFVRSRLAAERVMESTSKFIEKQLKLVVNREKSQVARAKRVTFLGMAIVEGTIAISKRTINRAMAKVKELTPRGTHETIEKTIEKINSWYMGWSGYYSLTQYPSQLKIIEAQIRRRLRSRIVSQQKRRRFLRDKLISRGVPKRQAASTAFSNKGRWALSRTLAMSKAYPNTWFEKLGLKTRSGEKRRHWFEIHEWINLT
jgi:RNA-directed DNA polymerase